MGKNFPRPRRVKLGNRFIKYQNFRGHRESGSNGKTLFLTA
jgi:hypothetical protein